MTAHKVLLLKKDKQDLFVRNSVSFSMNACLALETIMALRQEVTDAVTTEL